ncbi:MAG TPA: DUF4290 domain-containing protein [Saprospiraceae bacterium]|nr:DUF4290 domain-containing protein [Saprospiraceae bacterium]
MRHNSQPSFIYNTQTEHLIMPEYGRVVQDLVRHCKTLENDQFRQSFAESVIDLMQIMTPYNRNMDENRKKLWHHFFRIAEYDIKVNPPAGVEISPEKDIIHPTKIPYPTITKRNRHYGGYINQLIEKALKMEPGQKRDEFAVIIGSFMKLAVKTWNKEHYVSDEMIKVELNHMTNGELSIAEEVSLDAYFSNAKFQKRIVNYTSNNKARKMKSKSNSMGQNNNQKQNFKKKKFKPKQNLY